MRYTLPFRFSAAISEGILLRVTAFFAALKTCDPIAWLSELTSIRNYITLGVQNLSEMLIQ